jgi:hypothetical protein
MFKNNTSYFISLAVGVLFMIWAIAYVSSLKFLYLTWWGYPLVFTVGMIAVPAVIVGVDALLNKLVFKE